MNPPKKNERIIKVLKAALWGALLSAIVNFVAWCLAANNSLDLGTMFLFAMPTSFVQQIMGLNSAPQDSFFNSSIFAFLVNILFGSIVFALIAAIWQFVIKTIFKGASE
jgi:hypothetical protein